MDNSQVQPDSDDDLKTGQGLADAFAQQMLVLPDLGTRRVKCRTAIWDFMDNKAANRLLALAAAELILYKSRPSLFYPSLGFSLYAEALIDAATVVAGSMEAEQNNPRLKLLDKKIARAFVVACLSMNRDDRQRVLNLKKDKQEQLSNSSLLRALEYLKTMYEPNAPKRELLKHAGKLVGILANGRAPNPV